MGGGGIHHSQRTVLIAGEPCMQSGLEYKRIVLEELNKRIRSLQPETVIEVGSGNGLNVLALALLNPLISFKGNEPSQAGVDKSNDFKMRLPYEELSYLTGLSKEEIDNRKPKVTFEKKSIFDLITDEAEMIFTFNVIVLINDRKSTLKKIHNGTQKYAMFYESFEEYNNFFQKRRLKRKYTPCLKLFEVLNAGFKALLFNAPLVNKMHSQDNLLICTKSKRIKEKLRYLAPVRASNGVFP